MNIFLLCLFLNKKILDKKILILEMNKQENQYKKFIFNI